MPRLNPALIREAAAISPLLPILLPSCRTLSSARNELRWLREYVQEKANSKVHHDHQSQELLSLCKRRGKGEPLQYILGSQPFGELDIKCRPGVLIPRPETEAYTTYLAQLLLRGDLEPLGLGTKKHDVSLAKSPISILDVCSGSGCISLLLYSLLWKKYPQLRISGMDISTKALNLARANLEALISSGQLPKPASRPGHPQIDFNPVNIFAPWPENKLPTNYDIIISNPPYISEAGFMKETARSVRNWEPKLALVPQGNPEMDCAPEDTFYYRLLELQRELGSKILLMEVGDSDQAMRVAAMAMGTRHNQHLRKVEIWRDWPEEEDPTAPLRDITIDGERIPIKGTGTMRAILVSRL